MGNGIVAGTELYNRIKVARAKVQLHEDLVKSDPMHAWILEVPDEHGGPATYMPLENLVRDGFPAPLEAACKKLTRTTLSDGRPALTRESVYMISARFNTAEMVTNCKELKAALEDIDFPNIRLVEAAAGDQFGPMT